MNSNISLNSVQEEVLQKLLDNKKGFFKKYKSFYIYGKTGTGKTTVMISYLWKLQKKYLSMHFHDYLLDISRLLMHFSPKTIAKKIATKVEILCFDEFFIEAIADAKILYDVFYYLINEGVCIVATSNFAPEDLYKNGFNREAMFPKFSDFIYQNMEVISITSSKDYRRQANELIPIAFKNIHQFEESFNIKISQKKEQIKVDNNHNIEVIGKFKCGAVLDYQSFFKKHTSIKDYRKLARTFKHIHVVGMKSFSLQNEDEAIRFRNFIDILYVREVIFSFDDITTIDLFESEMLQNIKYMRCYSRLSEMQTKEYVFAKTKDFKRNLTIQAANFFEEIGVGN